MADFNIADLFNRNMMGAQGGGNAKGPDDGTNAEETGKLVQDGAANVASYAGKLVGMNLGELGQVSLAKAVGGDTEGFTSKPILQGVPDAKGGFLAKVLFDVFVKNGQITDHSQNHMANAGGAGGGGPDANFDPSHYLPVAGERFAVADIPEMPPNGFVPSAAGPAQSQSVEASV